jgi:hypothetical protein
MRSSNALGPIIEGGIAVGVDVNNRARGTPCTHIPTEHLRADCASMHRADFQLTYRVLQADVQALRNH